MASVLEFLCVLREVSAHFAVKERGGRKGNEKVIQFSVLNNLNSKPFSSLFKLFAFSFSLHHLEFKIAL